MLINTFSDGSREKFLMFTSNGERKVQFTIPKNAIVKSATLFLESQGLSDSEIIRIGVVHNYPLEELHQLEERLEETPAEKYSVRLGWGMEEKAPSYLPEERAERKRYALIPIDPSIIVSAHPSYYKQELDMIIIPNGPIHSDLSNLISSGIPILTMNPEVAIELGLARRQSLHAGLLTLRAADENHYITEQVAGEIIRIGLTRGRAGALLRSSDFDLDFDDRGRGKPGVTSDHVFVDALEIIPQNSRVVVDTGFHDQGVIVTDMRNKYSYFGITKIRDFIDDETIFNLFLRCIEWSAIGGNLTNVGLDIHDEPSGWRKPGFIEERTMTMDFSSMLNRMLDVLEPEEDGSYLIDATFYTDSPGILFLNDIRIDCSFLTNIMLFEEDLEDKTLLFDSIQQRQETYVNLPSQAKVLNATMKITGDLSQERIANRCIDEMDVYGVVVSGQYLVAQEIVPTQNLNITRISLHLAKLMTDTEIEVEIHPGHPEGQPLDEVITSKTLTGAHLAQTYDWIDIKFDKLKMLSDKTYWVVLRTKKGEANWHADVKSPCGGMLRYSKDGGKTWTNHNMDGLFKVFYMMEAYEPSPSFGIAGGRNVKWSYSGQFKEEYQMPDFANELNSYIKSNSDFGTKMFKVPLAFSSESIGSLHLSNLLIQCELPTLEMKEEIEGIPLRDHIKATLDLLVQLKNKLTQILDGLPIEALSEQVKLQKGKEK